MKFTSFYSQPVCGPTQTTLHTGCYPLRVAEVGNLKSWFPYIHPKESKQRAKAAKELLGEMPDEIVAQFRSGEQPEIEEIPSAGTRAFNESAD